MTPPEDPTRTVTPTDAEPTPTTLADNRTPADSGTLAQQDVPAHLFDPRLALTAVPGYVVSGEIARGGMGVVYAAHDPAFDREVAIKVMHPGQDADRFVIESKVTAKLPHPGVPPVYALGELPDGRPFLAMKHIRGRTLAEELRSADPGAELPRFLGIFEQVCQTVGFAHSQGIIHRDLKPANIMVGAFGEVLVMDWGLAKVGGTRRETGDSEDLGRGGAQDLPNTVSGWVKGTPAYMAPEQARGEEVGARADVFGLGCILFEVLTARRVYGDGSVEVILDRATGGRLRDAFARLDECGADAELVALAKRCLAPTADDRPADGRAAAEAVSGYRARVEERLRQAERDRAVSEAEAREQRKRRKVQLALAGAVGLLLAAGGGFAWWNQKRDADQARIETARLTAEADAERRMITGRTAAGDLLKQVEVALQAGDAERAVVPLAEAVLRIDEGGADDLRPRLARCRSEFDMLRKLDDIDNQRWVAVEGKAPPWATTTKRWAEAFADYGITLGVTPASAAARRIAESLIRERLLTALEVWFTKAGRDPAVRAILAAADPDEFRNEARATDYQRALLAWVFRGRSLPDAQPVWFAIGHGSNPSIDRGLREQLLLSAHRKQPNNFPLLMALSDPEGARDREWAAAAVGWYRAALAVQPRSVTAWNNLGVALRDLGDMAGAIAAQQEALQLDRGFVLAHVNLGNARYDSGDVAGATAAFREALRLDPKDVKARTNLGVALRESGDVTGAIAAHREALRLDPGYAKAHYNLGVALHDAGDVAGAIAAHRESIRLNPKEAKAHYNLGLALYDAGDVAGATAAFRAAIRVDPKYAMAHSNLGNALGASGDMAGAIAAQQEAIRLDPKYALAHYNLGAVYHAQKKYPEAIACARAAIQADPKLSNAHALLGDLLRRTGDLPGARAALTEAARLNPQWKPLLAKLPPVTVAPPPREVTQ